jgi:hypothetical protein
MIPALTETDVATLRDGFAGKVIAPGDPAYDDARAVFNAMIDRRPAVIAVRRSSPSVPASMTSRGQYTSGARGVSTSPSGAADTVSPAWRSSTMAS